MSKKSTIREPSNRVQSVAKLPIDEHFDTYFADQIAKLEAYNKHLYRPNTYLHKWWARRCGTTFRLILKHLVAQGPQQDYYQPGGLEGKVVLDPMMGGGTTLHEAVRLGANVVGADIDPIPILQARATLSTYALADLQAGFTQFFEAVATKLAPYYQTHCPIDEEMVPLRYMLYGLHRMCACDEALFVDSFVLRHNNDGSTIHLCPQTHHILRDGQVLSRSMATNPLPILERKVKRCSHCGQRYRDDMQRPYYQRYVPLAIVGHCPSHGLFFATPQASDYACLADAEAQRPSLPLRAADFHINPGSKSRSLVDRGIDNYLDLFSSRQLLFLQQAIEQLKGYDPLLRLNMALLVSTSLEFNSMLCGYKGAAIRRPGAIRHTFVRHAYAFPYMALENNPLHPRRASGTLQNLFHQRLLRGRKWALQPTERWLGNGKVVKRVIEGETDQGVEVSQFTELQHHTRRFMLRQGSSTALDLPDDSVDYVVTDPPYFDSVQYSDLAAFFRVWLRQLLPTDGVWEYAITESAVKPYSNGDGDGQYKRVLSQIFKECQRVLKKQHGRFIFTFHHWKPKGWEALTVALKRANFRLINRYVVHAENPLSVHIANQRVLLHDVILVLASAEAGVDKEWHLPPTINKVEGKAFCEDCGAVIGWLLNRDASEAEIEATWQQLLA